MPALYDAIGGTYARHRRADPRLAAAITAALGDARTVVNVGAGTGSYEPADRAVVAVEPAATMLAQRPPGAAPAVRARSEALPFADCVDGFTGAYWRRPEAYLDPAVRGGMSSFARIRDVAARIESLRADLASGAWARRHAGLLGREALDVGYRLVVARVRA